MFVLPNRFLVKIDSGNDYFRTYQHHVGVLRLTVEKATDIKGPDVGGKTGFLKKLVKVSLARGFAKRSAKTVRSMSGFRSTERVTSAREPSAARIRGMSA